MADLPPHLSPSRSSRGFQSVPDIPVVYGFGHVRVYESSGAEAPRLWLSVTESDDLNSRDPNGPTHEATAHLECEDAWKVADQLRSMVASHYQGDAVPEWVSPEEMAFVRQLREEGP